MDRKPLVSVIIPFLNQEKYLGEAIESVFEQTYDKWELLLVDDGSTDKSTDIAKEYAQRNPGRVFYIEHEGHKNTGLSHSRNVGVKQSRGEFIAPLDGDDVFLPEKLERQVKSALENPNAGLIFNPVFIWSQTDGKKEAQKVMLEPGFYEAGNWFNSIMTSFDSLPWICGVLIKKSAFEGVGGHEESFRVVYEDVSLWLKLSIASAMYYDTYNVAMYRIHDESVTGHGTYLTHLRASVQAIHWLDRYLQTVDSKGLNTGWPAIKMSLILIMMRHWYHTEQREIMAAMSATLEPLLPNLMQNPEWNYFTAIAFHYLKLDNKEAISRYDFAIKHGFDESGSPLQSSYEVFDAIANRGLVHMELKNYDKALEDLQAAINIKPNHEYVKGKLEELLSIMSVKLS